MRRVVFTARTLCQSQLVVVPAAHRLPSNRNRKFCSHSTLTSLKTISQNCVFFTKRSKSSKMTENNLCEALLNEDLHLARKIFEAGVEAANPSKAIRNKVSMKDSILTIQLENSAEHLQVDLGDYANCHIVGFGKAVLPMAEEILMIMGNKMEKCILSVPFGTRKPTNSQIEMNCGAKGNIPDSDALSSAEKIHNLAKSCSPEDLLIVLISGGGSALLPLPIPPITLAEKSTLIRMLSRAGASIFELNAIRKRISVLKGGGLVKICPAKRIVSLILSDVLNDPLDIIASGPTVNNPDDSSAAFEILKKYLPVEQIPPSVIKVLSGVRHNENEFQCFEKVTNIIIGNNKIALRAAAELAKQENLRPIILTSSLEGEAKDLGEELIEFALKILNPKYLKEQKATEYKLTQRLNISEEFVKDIMVAGLKETNLCLLLGGETTVNVSGSGCGGRNQELALSSAIALHTIVLNSGNPFQKITLLCSGTDGIDGPCEAAGAVVNKNTVPEANAQNIDPLKYLQNNDSFNFFKKVSDGKFHIVTGHTGTNVMDLIVLIIRF